MTFQARLKRAMLGGNLRIADLARLFDRRHSTVRGWVIDGREPAGTPADIRELFTVLTKVEMAIGKKPGASKMSRTQRASVLAEVS